MSNSKITNWQEEIKKYQSIRANASTIISKLTSLRSNITITSEAFENIVVHNGKTYDDGQLKEHNDSLSDAITDFQNLKVECNQKISELSSKISAERIRIQEEAAKKAAEQKNNTNMSSNPTGRSSSLINNKNSQYVNTMY